MGRNRMNKNNLSKENLIGLTIEEAKNSLEWLYPNKEIKIINIKETVSLQVIHNRIDIWLNENGFIAGINVH